MAYVRIGRVVKYYDLSNEAEIEIENEGLVPGDYVRVGSLNAEDIKVTTLTLGTKSVEILRVGETGTINVNGIVAVNDFVYKNI